MAQQAPKLRERLMWAQEPQALLRARQRLRLVAARHRRRNRQSRRPNPPMPAATRQAPTTWMVQELQPRRAALTSP